MPIIPEPTKQWYVVHVLSGQEQKVARRIRSLVEKEELQEYIYEVLVPMEMVSEVKRGKKTETKRKFFPGYIIINMNLFTAENELVEETWYM